MIGSLAGLQLVCDQVESSEPGTPCGVRAVFVAQPGRVTKLTQMTRRAAFQLDLSRRPEEAQILETVCEIAGRQLG